MSETSEVVRPFIDGVNKIPCCYAYRVHSGKVKVRGGWMHCAEEGFPDVAACVHGYAMFFECKLPGEKPSTAQIEMHEKLRRSGAMVLVIESAMEGLRHVVEHLRCIEENGRGKR